MGRWQLGENPRPREGEGGDDVWAEMEMLYCPATGTTLTELGLYENQIVDVSPLSTLTSLTELDLRWNQIVDRSPLSHLKARIRW